jgi:hypothetical protein
MLQPSLPACCVVLQILSGCVSKHEKQRAGEELCAQALQAPTYLLPFLAAHDKHAAMSGLP